MAKKSKLFNCNQSWMYKNLIFKYFDYNLEFFNNTIFKDLPLSYDAAYYQFEREIILINGSTLL